MADKEGTGRIALITGASAGIGSALTRVFAQNGFDVVLTARRQERRRLLADEVTKTHAITTHVIPADLGEPAAPIRIFEEVERRGLRISALVNNAGYGVPRSFRNNAWTTHAAFIQVMVTAVVHLTHLLERGMTERRYGRILNVSSLAGLLPGSAGHTLYAASKAFLVKFSESLALEHQGDGVHVTALCPGFTHTEFHDVLGNKGLVSRLPSYMWTDAESVAREGYRAVMAGDVLCIPGVVNRAIASGARLIPESIALRLMSRESKRLRITD